MTTFFYFIRRFLLVQVITSPILILYIQKFYIKNNHGFSIWKILDIQIFF